MIFTLLGPFQPYTRQTRRSKHADPRAKSYNASQEALAWAFKQQMGDYEMIPRGVPLSLIIRIQHSRDFHDRDLTNEVKAAEDAAQRIVYKNDCWVDEIYAVRTKAGVDRVYFEVHPCGRMMPAYFLGDDE